MSAFALLREDAEKRVVSEKDQIKLCIVRKHFKKRVSSAGNSLPWLASVVTAAAASRLWKVRIFFFFFFLPALALGWLGIFSSLT